ncbi:MAG: hypothetical protein R3B57_12060 [Phycisphaerales bacterium]
MTDGQTGADAQAWADSLERRIEELGDLLARLDELGDSQGELIADERTDELLALLAKREAVVEQVVAASERVDALRRRWDEMSGSIDHGRLATLREGLDGLTAAAGRITARDDRDRTILEVKRDDMARRLAGVGVGQRAMNAYASSPSGPSPKFQDRKA